MIILGILLLLAVGFAALFLLLYLLERQKADNAMAQAMFELSVWKQAAEKELRADALKRSVNTVRGKVSEQLAPLTVDFEYSPRDARFLGSPVDLIVFDGLEHGKVDQVVFVEVKTGKSVLTGREVEVKRAIEEGNVFYQVLRLKEPTSE